MIERAPWNFMMRFANIHNLTDLVAINHTTRKWMLLYRKN